jgi:hypothetical protein
MTRSAPAPAGALGEAPSHRSRVKRTRFTESDEEAGIRGPCQSAIHSGAMTRSAPAPTGALGETPSHRSRVKRTRFTESDEEAGIARNGTQAASASDRPTRALICSAT